jgi:hypothetical protein
MEILRHHCRGPKSSLYGVVPLRPPRRSVEPFPFSPIVLEAAVGNTCCLAALHSYSLQVVHVLLAVLHGSYSRIHRTHR